MLSDEHTDSRAELMAHPLPADLAFQESILQDVSRTFALTIPQLPDPLRLAVSNGYLLCRIADTIEDDADMDPGIQREFSEQFINVVEGSLEAERFAAKLSPLLSDKTPPPEHDLIANCARVIRITHSFNANQRRALARCVRIMARGMADFQDQESLAGLEDMRSMDRYCYYVAGVVGEMLTDLFCDYSEDIKVHKPELMKLAVSFGQGLQMTNILKDIWEDRRRGACWLPRDIFGFYGIDLETVPTEGCKDPKFASALGDLIAIAKKHLENALRYTLLLPRTETGLRRFCLWALGMAVLTLRKIDACRDFTTGQQVKISRRSVKATTILTGLVVSSNGLLEGLFYLTARGLPDTHIHEQLETVRFGSA